MIKRLSIELRTRYDTVEWSDIAKFRDMLSHNYEGVNLFQVWKTIKREVTPLKEECESILNDLRDHS
jgi:Uncharacterized conserved protein